MCLLLHSVCLIGEDVSPVGCQYVFSSAGNAEMTDRSHAPKFESHALIKDKVEAKPNPFKMDDPVRLRDGSATNGTVTGIMGNQVLVAWGHVAGDPQWYHQDFVVMQKTSVVERSHAPPAEDKAEARANPFNIGDSVRLRDGTFTNGTVTGILVDEVLVAWDNVPGDPQWYSKDFIARERKPAERSRALPGNQTEQDIVGDACRLVARMDDDQRRRFIAHIQEVYGSGRQRDE